MNEELNDLLKNLVTIQSINGDEADLGEYLEQYCLDAGLLVRRSYCTEKRFNVMVEYPLVERADAPCGVLLHGHYDTVGALDMDRAFEPRIEGEFMVGRGTVDQKAGIAASIMALISLKRQGAVLDKGVTIALVIDEESEHRGSMKLVEEGIRAECALVTEPTQLRCVLGCKGTLPIKITVTGKAAHGCRPWLGVNAVQKALPILEGLFALEFPPKDFGEGLGILKNSVNVGVVKAGSAYNNVPDTCEISLDCRIRPGDTVEAMMQHIRDVIEQARIADEQLNVSMEVSRPDWQWDEIIRRGLKSAFTPMDSPLYREIREVHERLFGEPLESYITDGYADLDFMVNDLGIPSVMYGPGNPRLCHTSKEQVSLVQVEGACNFYEAFILNHCKEHSAR